MKEMHLVLKVTKQQIRAYSETNPANYWLNCRVNESKQ